MYVFVYVCVYIYVYMYIHTHHIFIYSSIFGHLSCFCVWFIASGLLCIIDGVHKSFQVTIFSRYISRNGLLDHMTILFFVFWGISILFSIGAVPVCISIISAEGSLFSTSPSAFVICRLFSDGSSDQYEVVPHCTHFICISK